MKKEIAIFMSIYMENIMLCKNNPEKNDNTITLHSIRRKISVEGEGRTAEPWVVSGKKQMGDVHQ